MLLSCKLSNAVLNFLDHRGEDLGPLLDAVNLPEEFLRDPSYWMPAADMESFLEQVLRYPWQTTEENFLQKMAHSAPEYRSWGVLDSVLRMMPRPEEMLAQPNRFLANFISPDPPIDKIVREETGVAFDLPISREQFPLVTGFLCWSFETLPRYVGKELAHCEWIDIRLSLRWDSKQNSMFDAVDSGHQISPTLLKQIVASLEKHSHELQQKNLELQSRNEQLLNEQKSLEAKVQSSADSHGNFFLPRGLSCDETLDRQARQSLRQNLGRLMDTFVRAQQLITLLVAQDRLNPTVKEAMRRVDWDRVKAQFPEIVDDCFSLIESNKLKVKSEPFQEESPHV